MKELGYTKPTLKYHLIKVFKIDKARSCNVDLYTDYMVLVNPFLFR